MAKAEGTESLKIKDSVLDRIRSIATLEDRTIRAQVERFLTEGAEAYESGKSKKK